MNARIDAESSGEYADLDSQGRYKVVLPFDLSGRRGGKASAWLRMAQPYAGSNHGMHFPLHKGTEVLLTFIDGDPDRPIIAAAVPNPETPSVVNDQSLARAGFVTPGGGCLVADDTAGKEQIAIRQGNDAMIALRGSGLGAEAGTWSNYAWHYAGKAELGVAMAFQYGYSAGTFIQSVGFKKQAMGILNLLTEGSSLLPALLPGSKPASEPSSLMEKIIPMAMLATNLTTAWLIEKQIKARINAKLSLPTSPKVGYGIYADDKGAITYMKAPWLEDNPDIGVVSASGSVDVVAGKEVTIWADKNLQAAATENVAIRAGRTAGTVEVSGDKVEITASGHGVSINGKMEGVKIGTTLGDIQIDSEFGPIKIARTDGEGNAKGEVEIDALGNINLRTGTGKITLQAGASSVKLSDAGLVEVVASHGVTITVGKSKIEVEGAGITISSPYDVKINELVVADKTMTYKGQTVNIANVLKIK